MFKFVKSLRQKPPTNTLERLKFRGREVVLVRRPYKRTLSLSLQVSGKIRLSAPKRASQSQVLDFLLANQNWIETNLASYQEIRESYPPKTLIEGESFRFLGKDLILQFKSSTRRRSRFFVAEDKLICEIHSPETEKFDPKALHPELLKALISFYEKSGREVIGARLEHFANKMQLHPSSVSFRAQKTRWGSCSSRKKISLNWRLIVAPLEVIDYVVVHELSHLRHYNHSKHFWDLVSQQIPEHRQLRKWLKEHQYETDFLARRSELHASV